MGRKASYSNSGTKSSIYRTKEELTLYSKIRLLENKVKVLEEQNALLKSGKTKIEELQAALISSKERYNTLVGISVNTITIIQKGKIVFSNPAFAKALGYSSADEIFGKEFSSFFIPAEYNELSGKFKHLEVGRSTETAQLKLVKKDGSELLIGITSMPVQHENQPAILFIGENITPWKESEKALRESEQKLKALFDCAPDCIFMTDLNYKIRYFNRPLFGYTIDELVHSDFFGLFADEYKEQAWKSFRNVEENHTTSTFEFKLNKSNLNLWLSCRIALLSYSDNPAGFIIILTDITEKHLAITELKTARKEWQDIFEAIGQPALILDKEHNIINANKAVMKITGKKQEELCKLKCFEVFHKRGEHAPGNCPMQSLLTSKSFESQEMEIEIPGGSYMVSCTPILDEKGDISRIIHIATDISDIKKAKNELSASLTRYQKLVDTIPYGIDEIDLNGNIRITNTAHIKMLGFTAEELVSMTVFDLQKDEQQKDALRLYFEKIKTDRPVPKPFFSKNITSGGKVIDVQVDWNYLEDNQGNLQGYITVISDITERIKAEQEIKNAKEKAEESDRLKSAFLTNISHEVRTPLNGIIGFTAMLNNEKIPIEKRKEYGKFVQKSADQLLVIINDLIDISRIESGLFSISYKTFNLNSFMDELFHHFQNEITELKKEQIELILKFQSNENEIFIESDEVRLRQVLINLLSNAVKFSRKGKIEFGYRTHQESKLLFYVKDNGIGIAKENIKFIFERFRQEDDSFVREYGGTGLGLAISRGIVEKMGGEIWAESVKNKGSVFYFTIPYKNTVPGTSADDRKRELYVWPHTSFLIVEDDPVNTELLKATFKSTESENFYAKDGEEAIQVFNENPGIDIVLLDIRIPYIDGYSVARQMKKLSPKVIIIAHTAYAKEAEKSINGDDIFDGFIAKPALPVAILEYINKYISKEGQ